MSVYRARQILSGATASLARAIMSVTTMETASDSLFIERPGSEDPFPRTAVVSTFAGGRRPEGRR